MANTTKTAAKKSTTKKGAGKRASAKSASAPAPAPAPAPKKEEVVAAPESTESSEQKTGSTVIQEEFTTYLAKIQQAVSLLSTLRQDFRQLERKTLRELKACEKASSKRRRRATSRAPSGFVKPTRISDELATFLGKESGTQMARTEVTREINAYIREHKLQDKENGRKINADKKLSSLLSLGKDDQLTYFNLQKFMSRHFAKAGQPVESS